jgi:erythromycin esterase
MKAALVVGLFVMLASCKDDNVAEQNREDIHQILDEVAIEYSDVNALDTLVVAAGSSRYVLLGEASHGTSEFYSSRADLSKELILKSGFNVIAVEGDWPALYMLNRYIKGDDSFGASAKAVLQQMKRWPTWMWANEEIAELAEWLRGHNDGKPAEDMVSFYGLDVYSLWESLEELNTYFEDEQDATALSLIATTNKCFQPYNKDEYGYATAATERTSCAGGLQELEQYLRERVEQAPDDALLFNAWQNALTATNAERYYTTSIHSYADSWNIRDRHMVETVENLMNFHGSESKIIIWRIIRTLVMRAPQIWTSKGW